MSSLHQDRLLVEGPEPRTGSAPTLTTTLDPAGGTSRRPAEEKAISTLPTQRQGTAQRSGTTVTGRTPATRTRRTVGAKAAAAASGRAGTLASRARAVTNVTAKVASARVATVTAAAGKVPTAKAPTAKTATAKTATAKTPTAKDAAAAKAAEAAKVATRAAAGYRTATATPVANPVVVKTAPARKPTVAKDVVVKASPAAKPAAAKAATTKAATTKAATTKAAAVEATPAPKATAAKATAAKATAAKTAPAAEPAAASTETAWVRPTPYKRTAPVTEVAAPVAQPVAAPDVVTEAPAVVADVAAEGRRSRFLRRRPTSIGRRPALYLAAALVGATALTTAATVEPVAQATENMSHSVSVAEELGIRATPAEAITDSDAAELLGELAVSRNARSAEQAAAAQVQAEADRVAAAAAAEAARPKVVLPVAGARLTSGFGSRWGTQHAGIDLAAPVGTPEYAAMDGIVLEAGPASGYGLVVYIQHANGDVTVYGHMQEILVQPGQVVRAGDTIALLGNRGQSTGPHLHFEVQVGGPDGQKIDPLPWLRDKGIAI